MMTPPGRNEAENKFPPDLPYIPIRRKPFFLEYVYHKIINTVCMIYEHLRGCSGPRVGTRENIKKTGHTPACLTRNFEELNQTHSLLLATPSNFQKIIRFQKCKASRI